ncbi:IS3 family transposase [Bacillus sp. AFS029533]|uniref:IS3 family transposase n=1 Tax=Bacillus sp. AFS029533 TaxID=2033494 RepID=UPI00256FCF9F|nr:IS3 family transposase [Bacillus sp. AFS029533]
MHQHRHEFRVSKMCKVLGVSRSGYYDWLKRPQSKRTLIKEKLSKQIKEIYLESNKRYGAIKILRTLNKHGSIISLKTVQRLMKANSLRSITVKKYRAKQTEKQQEAKYPNILNQNFKTSAPGQVWVSDITYIWTREGWLYLASVMDLYSRKIIGFSTSSRMTTALPLMALKRAMKSQPPKQGLIHHSDQGSQYRSEEYIQCLEKANIRISMSRKGNCYDNACIEAFHSILKRELIYRETYETRETAEARIFEYIVCFYNAKRIHSAIGYLTPNEMDNKAS